jgi:hypothetical protein
MAKAKTTKMKLDMMSVTVLLVMSVFGGVVGYFLGKGATAAQVVSLREAATMMQEKGVMMQDAGKLMDEKGKRMGDKEMTDKGKMLMESGSVMSGKGTGMMGMMQDY